MEALAIVLPSPAHRIAASATLKDQGPPVEAAFSYLKMMGKPTISNLCIVGCMTH